MRTGLRGEWTGEQIIRPKVVELVAERCRLVLIASHFTFTFYLIESKSGRTGCRKMQAGPHLDQISNHQFELFNFGDPFATVLSC